MENQTPPRKPKLRWDISMRQALCCIYRFFRCDKKAKEEIFFSMFRDKLRKRGINRFVPDKTLHAQWSWMRNTGDQVWCRVHRDTDFKMDGEWEDIIQKIRTTAVNLRLPLLERTEDDIDTTRWGTRAKMALGPRAESPLETPHRMPVPPSQREEERRYFAEGEDRSSESGTMSVGHSPERIDHPEEIYDRIHESVVTSHGKTCIWCSYGSTIDETDGLDAHSTMSNDPVENNHHHQSQQPLAKSQEQVEHPDYGGYGELQELQYCGEQPHGQDHHHDHHLAMQGVARDKMPPLLLRWSNCDSQGINSRTQFLAGVFCDSDSEWFNPEDLPESIFESFFRSHVTKEKVRTPFISTFRSPLAPIHRAVARKNGAILTVIDTSKLKNKVFYAFPLAGWTKTRVYKGWQGYGEYLIWGSIPTEAIAHTVEIANFERIVQSHRDINRLVQLSLIRSSPRCNDKLRETLALRRKLPFESGRTLGKLLTLLQTPTPHGENLAFEFAKAWGWRHKKEVALFLDGFRSGPPYLPEELADSESEAVWPIPQKTPGKTPQKMYFLSDQVSDVDYEPPETDEESGSTSESECMAQSRSMSVRSMSIRDEIETEDDGKFSTHETLSSGIFTEGPGAEGQPEEVQHQKVIDLTCDNGDWRDWPSADGEYMHLDTTPNGRLAQPRNTPRFVLDGQMDMDFFEKFRHWP